MSCADEATEFVSGERLLIDVLPRTLWVGFTVTNDCGSCGSCNHGGCCETDEDLLIGRPGRDADHGFDGQVPFYIDAGEVYRVAEHRQVLFTYPIEIAAGGSLEIHGILAEVS